MFAFLVNVDIYQISELCNLMRFFFRLIAWNEIYHHMNVLRIFLRMQGVLMETFGVF